MLASLLNPKLSLILFFDVLLLDFPPVLFLTLFTFLSVPFLVLSLLLEHLLPQSIFVCHFLSFPRSFSLHLSVVCFQFFRHFSVFQHPLLLSQSEFFKFHGCLLLVLSLCDCIPLVSFIANVLHNLSFFQCDFSTALFHPKGFGSCDLPCFLLLVFAILLTL